MIYYYKAQSVDIDDNCFHWKWNAFTTLIGSSFCENFQLITLHNSDTYARSEKRNGYEGFAKTGNYIKSLLKRSEDKAPPVIFLKPSDKFTDSVFADFIRALAPKILLISNYKFDDRITDLSNSVRRYSHRIVGANCNCRHETKSTELTKPSNVEDEFINVKNEAERVNKEVNVLIALGRVGFEMIKEICKNITEFDFIIVAFLWHDTFITAPSKEIPKGHYLTMSKHPGKSLLSPNFDEQGELLKAVGRDNYFVFFTVTFPDDCFILRLLKRYPPQTGLMKKYIFDFTKIESLLNSWRTEERSMANLDTNALINYKVKMYNHTGAWTNYLIVIVSGVILKDRYHSVIDEGYGTQIVQKYSEYSETITSQIESRVSRTKLDVKSTYLLSKGYRLKLICILALYLAISVFLTAFALHCSILFV